jgi:hypothetical protein
MSELNELASFIGWVIGVAFFIWFGCTLASINSKLGVIAAHAVANSSMRPEPVASKPCSKCGASVPAAAVYCTLCGGRA